MWKHFQRSEFACPCCNHNHMQDHVIDMFDLAREEAGIPMSVNSGWRCEKHNRRVHGSKGSSHKRGLAGDIRCRGNRQRFHIIRGLMVAGFQRILIYKTFIHADADIQKAQQILSLM